MHYYGIDTEFLQSGTKNQSDVHTIQISNGEKTWVFKSHEELFGWFRKKAPKLLFTWTTEAEFGSFKAWKFIGADPYRNDLDRIKRFWIERPSRNRKNKMVKTLVFDIQPFFKEMTYKGKTLGSLSAIGEFLSDFYKKDLHKLDKPLGDDFGLRKPETDEEWKYFEEYSAKDALICSWAAKWFIEEILSKYVPNVNIRKLFSFGTIAKHYFNLPQLHVRIGWQTILRPWYEDIWKKSIFAGRNECFTNGYLGKIYYNDIASLYPIVTVWLHALEIRDIECVKTPKNCIDVQDYLTELSVPYAWIEGVFESHNDIWGLPKRGNQRNYYVVGDDIDGMYHTYDLLAAKAKIKKVDKILIPKFKSSIEQERFQKLTMKKLEHDYDSIPEKYCIKGVLNSLTGKLGQAKPQVSVTSNFPAYSTILAGSHYLMSQMFDQYAPVYYTDTDSFFSCDPVNSEVMTLTSIRKPHWTVPVEVEVKGESDDLGTIIFRSKHYYQSESSFGFHGWKAFWTDWFKIVTELPNGISVNRQIARTFRTRDKKAQELQIGRWMTIKELYTNDKLVRLFRADDKRVRKNYDSYVLAQNRQKSESQAWDYNDWKQYRDNEKNALWRVTSKGFANREQYLPTDELRKTLERNEKLRKYQLHVGQLSQIH